MSKFFADCNDGLVGDAYMADLADEDSDFKPQLLTLQELSKFFKILSDEPTLPAAIKQLLNDYEDTNRPTKRTKFEDKSKEDKSKEDKSKEDKSKEDKSKEDKSKEDKSKEDKSKDEVEDVNGEN